MNPENLLWVEKFRPQTLDDVILPERLKAEFRTMVEQGEAQNLLLAGGPGSGKTTLARALAHDLGCDLYMINGSDESGIDVIRTKVKSFAATVSVMTETKHKIVLLDEADYLTPNSQAAMRGLIEEFWQNCRFIFTCNYKNRIIPALHSRCTVIDFSFSKDEKLRMMAQFLKRVEMILKENGITYDKKALGTYIMGTFPDFRRTLNELQRYSASGSIDAGILRLTGDDAIQEITNFLRSKNFREMRSWVDSNPSIDPVSLFEKLYTQLTDHILPESQPELILVLDEYQTKALTALNPKINMAACLTTLMSVLQWKN